MKNGAGDLGYRDGNGSGVNNFLSHYAASGLGSTAVINSKQEITEDCKKGQKLQGVRYAGRI